MKKLIILSAIILSGLGFSTKVYGQRHIDVNENTGCTYTIKIYWDEGFSGGRCQNSAYIWIPGSSTTNYTNPWTPAVGGAVGVEVICNNCGDVALIGDCANLYCYLPCSWVCCYTHTCGYGSPVNYRFTPYSGINNAILDIYYRIFLSLNNKQI